jgi:hypothetical protein
MVDKVLIGLVDPGLLPRMASVESDFLTVVNQVRVACSVISFQSLFDGSEPPKRGREEPKDNSRNKVVGHHIEWSSEAHEFRQFSGEENDVKHWLGEVRVDLRQRIRPLLNICRQSLVWIWHSTIEVRKLVVDHVLKVSVVEVVGQSLTESDGQALIEEIQIAIHE